MSEPARSSDQQRVLADIRRALGRSETARPAPLEPFIQVTATEDIEELVARFIKEVTAVGGKVYQARSGEEVSIHIAQICHDAAVREVALSGALLLSEINLQAQLATHDLMVIASTDFAFDEQEKLIARLAGCGAGVTAIDHAIAGVTAIDYAVAETGTIALSSDEEHALFVSLLPAIHIAVLSAQQIYGSLVEVVGKLTTERMRRAEPCRTATFITGPSRTSDVELTLSIGVHGPKELHLIILQCDASIS